MASVLASGNCSSSHLSFATKELAHHWRGQPQAGLPQIFGASDMHRGSSASSLCDRLSMPRRRDPLVQRVNTPRLQATLSGTRAIQELSVVRRIPTAGL